MRRSHLKITLLGWSLLAIVTVWVDRWAMSLFFDIVTCLLGAVFLTTGALLPGLSEKNQEVLAFCC